MASKFWINLPAVKSDAPGLAVARFVCSLLVFTLAISIVAQPVPPRADVRLAWDYPQATNLPTFALLWGTNRMEVGTNLTASVSLEPGLHRFTAIAIRNGLESDPSNEVRVRTVGFTLDSAPSPVGPWTNRQSFTTVLEMPPASEFYRVRVWQ